MAAGVDADLAGDEFDEETVRAHETAPGVGDIGVDLLPVTAEPVMVGAHRA